VKSGERRPNVIAAVGAPPCGGLRDKNHAAPRARYFHEYAIYNSPERGSSSIAISSKQNKVEVGLPNSRKTGFSSSSFLGQTPYSENLLCGGESVSARNLVLNSRRKFRIAPSDEQQIVTPYEIGCFVAANAIHMEP
jgi:hypothetical protein